VFGVSLLSRLKWWCNFNKTQKLKQLPYKINVPPFIAVCGGLFVSRGAHCASGAANDQSNPNLQVAWQRLQPLLPPLITTGNQLACHTRSARHETSPGSSATQCGLGKSRRALLKGQGGHGSPISIPPPPPLTPLQGRRAADLQPHQQIILRFSFGCASFRESATLLSVMPSQHSSAHMLAYKRKRMRFVYSRNTWAESAPQVSSIPKHKDRSPSTFTVTDSACHLICNRWNSWVRKPSPHTASTRLSKQTQHCWVPLCLPPMACLETKWPDITQTVNSRPSTNSHLLSAYWWTPLGRGFTLRLTLWHWRHVWRGTIQQVHDKTAFLNQHAVDHRYQDHREGRQSRKGKQEIKACAH